MHLKSAESYWFVFPILAVFWLSTITCFWLHLQAPSTMEPAGVSANVGIFDWPFLSRFPIISSTLEILAVHSYTHSNVYFWDLIIYPFFLIAHLHYCKVEQYFLPVIVQLLAHKKLRPDGGSSWAAAGSYTDKLLIWPDLEWESGEKLQMEAITVPQILNEFIV